jgi:hypothetical protein
MAKRKKRSKVQKRAELRRENSAKRSKPRKGAKSAAVKRAKPKRAAVKKAPGKEVRKQPVRETVVVNVVEQPAPGVIAVTEFEETVTREESPGPG